MISAEDRFADNVLPRSLIWRAAGLKSALVTLVGVEGRSPRPLGSQMAVAETGEYVGHISAGCAEASIVAEAVAALSCHENRSERYGAGSRYVDVKLPCGSGIDVYFDVRITDAILQSLQDAISKRTPVALRTDIVRHTHDILSVDEFGQPNRDDNIFVRPYLPVTRLLAFGSGPILASVVAAGVQLGWDVVAGSSDQHSLQFAERLGAKVRHMTAPELGGWVAPDPWTASVTLFHDHDWEPPILKALLAAPCFYVGALGSRATHAERSLQLAALGVSDGDIARVRGPAGLKIAAQTPAEIAISIVGEIIAARNGGT